MWRMSRSWVANDNKHVCPVTKRCGLIVDIMKDAPGILASAGTAQRELSEFSVPTSGLEDEAGNKHE